MLTHLRDIAEIVLSRLVEGERQEVGHHLVLLDPVVQCHRPGKGVGVVRRWPTKGQYAHWGMDKGEILLADELHPMMVDRIRIGVMVAGVCAVMED